MTYYRAHIFFCTNFRDNERKCCAKGGGAEAVTYFKAKVVDAGLKGPGGVRVSHAGCMGRCALGPAMVIYPQGMWYTFRDNHDLDEIFDSHILNNVPVPRLFMSPD